MVKAGTPTMGGVAIVVGALAGYIVSNLYDGVFTWTGIASMVAIAGRRPGRPVRRLAEGRQGAEPRAEQAGEDDRAAARRARRSSPSC